MARIYLNAAVANRAYAHLVLISPKRSAVSATAHALSCKSLLFLLLSTRWRWQIFYLNKRLKIQKGKMTVCRNEIMNYYLLNDVIFYLKYVKNELRPQPFMINFWESFTMTLEEIIGFSWHFFKSCYALWTKLAVGKKIVSKNERRSKIIVNRNKEINNPCSSKNYKSCRSRIISKPHTLL